MSLIVSRFNNFHITSPLQLSLQIQLRSYKTQLIVIALKRSSNSQRSSRKNIKIEKSFLKKTSCSFIGVHRWLAPSEAMTIQQPMPPDGEEAAAKKVFFVSPDPILTFSLLLVNMSNQWYESILLRGNLMKKWERNRFRCWDNKVLFFLRIISGALARGWKVWVFNFVNHDLLSIRALSGTFRFSWSLSSHWRRRFRSVSTNQSFKPITNWIERKWIV